MHADSSSFDIDTQPYAVFDGADVYCPVCGDAFSPLVDRCPDDDAALLRIDNRGDRLLGTLLDDRYRILRQIGAGAMGLVYEAVQLSARRVVAVKVIREELARELLVTQRFLREARLLTSIAHPNVVEVFDYGETETGCLYLVMELLRGNTLDTILAHELRFSAQRTCEIAIQLCDALTAAHAQGVVHRDLKPANVVLLPGFGTWIKVLDFGLAKQLSDSNSDLTAVGAVIGTPMYMAPETIRCDTMDLRSDLYALGCLLYELLTGTPPFEGDTSAMVLARQLDDMPRPLPADVPPELRKLVLRLLAKHPGARPGSAFEVRRALEVILVSIALQGKS